MTKTKKKGKSGGHPKSSHRRGGHSAKADAIGMLTDKRVLVGAGISLVGALLIDGFVSKLVPNIHARNLVKAAVPPLIAQTIMKDPMTTVAAAAVGLALGAGSYMESMVKKTMPSSVAGLLSGEHIFSGTSGLLGEAVYRQTPVDQGQVVEMRPTGVDGEYEYENAYNVNGEFIGRALKKRTARVSAQSQNARFQIPGRGDFLAGEGDEDVSGEYDEEDVSGQLAGFPLDRISGGSYFRDEV